MKADVHIIDLRLWDSEGRLQPDQLPERIVLDKDAKLEAQPCGSTEWVALENKGEVVFGFELSPCHTDGCPNEALTVLKKDKKQVTLPSGKVRNVDVVAFETHLLRVTGKYEVADAHPWCIPCRTHHAEGKHKHSQPIEPTTT